MSAPIPPSTTFLALLLTYLALTTNLPPTTATPPTNPRAKTLALFKKALIADYLRWHKSHRNTAPRLVYRLNRRQPGLGDRITGLWNAYIHAVFSHRVFLLHWQHPFNLNTLLLSNSGAHLYYNPTTDTPLESTRKTLHCLNRCNTPDLTPFLTPAFTVIANASLPLHVRDILKLARNHPTAPASRTLLAGLGPDALDDPNLPSDAELFSALFAAVLRPSPLFQRFTRDYAGPLLTRRYVSVHARLGSGVDEGGPRFRTAVSWRDLAACLGRRAIAMGERLRTDGTIFLATDTPGFRAAFRKAIVSEGGAAMQRKVLFGTWGTKHLGRMEVDDERDLELFRCSIMEMMLLGRGVGMVSTVSRFATVGALVGGVNERDLVVPEEC